MPDPLAAMLDELAPTVDEDAARTALALTRRKRRDRVRIVAAVSAAVVLVAGGVGLVLSTRGGDDPVLTDRQPAATAPSVAPTSAPTTSSSIGLRVSFTADRSASDQPGCSHPACRFVDVTLTGFPPGSNVTVSCHGESVGVFGASNVRIERDGSAAHEACYFGYPGERFWVDADGITSPTVTWPP